jgi:hypothetical protein
MTGAIPLMRLPVGVVIERRKAKSPWIDFVWRPVAVLPGVPEAERGARLGGDDERLMLYAGSAEVELFASDAAQYYDNLISGAPGLWVIMRPVDGDPPYQVFSVTADPSEGEAYTEPGADLVEAVSMPDDIRAEIEAFVSQHYVEEKFVKRQRSKADPEALARRGPLSKGEKR